MFPGTREVLLYALGFLVIVMVALVILIMRKRFPLGSIFRRGKKEEAPEPRVPDSETGPADTKSIKDRLMSVVPSSGKHEEAPEAPEPPEPPSPEGAPEPPKQSVPVEGAVPVMKEGVIEQGMELKTASDEPEDEGYGLPEEKPTGKVPMPKPEYMVVDDKKEVKKPEPKPVKEKELVAKGLSKPKENGIVAKFVPRKINALEPEAGKEAHPTNMDTSTPVDSAAITKNLDTFLGQTVAIEGDIQLSSKGFEDVWYVLFDKSGSMVVRSEEEIPFKRCRIFARVEKTKLGQLYLDVTRFERP
jgi:hypothetical protein